MRSNASSPPGEPQKLPVVLSADEIVLIVCLVSRFSRRFLGCATERH